MVTPLIAGNWKMNAGGATGMTLVTQLKNLIQDVSGVDVVVCPPMIAVQSVATAVAGSSVDVGAQDCHMAQKGAHTGDVAASMIASAGAKYVIVGHSERRADHGETNQIVSAKAKASQDAGLTPIICVGETQAEREADQAEAVVLNQLAESVPDGAAVRGVVIAYEPVWAIGTGLVATVDDIKAMHASIRNALEARFEEEGAGIRILYGGSMKAENAADILAVPHVNGGLVGGASLDAEAFAAIIRLTRDV